MSEDDPGAGQPRPWLRPTLVIGSGLLAFLGFVVSPLLGMPLAVLAGVVCVGSFLSAARQGQRRTRSLGQDGEKRDTRLLERRLLVYFWLILVCFAVATVGVVLVLTSAGHRGPDWPLILLVVLMGGALLTIWVYARVVLPRQRQGQ